MRAVSAMSVVDELLADVRRQKRRDRRLKLGMGASVFLIVGSYAITRWWVG